MAIALPIVPEGTKSAASMPSISAAFCLEAVDGRVLAVDVVADLGLGHGLAHLGRRPGDGVGAQVDRLHGRDVITRRPRFDDAPAAASRVR